MNSQPVVPPKRFVKTVLSLVLALPLAGTLLYAHTRDTPIDYSSFRSAAEVRAAALRRIEQTIQALSTPGAPSTVPSGATPVPAQPVATTVQSVDAVPVDAGLPVSQSEGAVASVQADSVPAAQTPPSPPDPLAGRALALGDASLDEVRGGFDVPGSDLKYTFGIERAVFINGELMARTVLRLQDLGTVAGRGVAVQELTGANGAATLDVIQNGPGNHFTAQVGPDMVGTVIQNTLDNQKIQHVTTINASINSLQVMRAMSVQSAVQSGIVDSIRR